MKKCIIVTLILILVFTGCSQNGNNPGQGKNNESKDITKETITEEQIVGLQLPVIEFRMKDQAFEVSGCYSQPDEDSGLMTMYIEANEEPNVDYEDYKEKIWENVGAEFNIIFELIPFPEYPTSEGVIRSITYNDTNQQEGYLGTLLIVSQTRNSETASGEIYFEANFITVLEDDIIINKKGKEVTFEDLQVGMFVDSYNRGEILPTYPGQQRTEKLVIHEDYKIPMADDSMSDTRMGEIFGNENMTGPYPIAINGPSQLFVNEDVRLYVHMEAGGMVYYKDTKTLEEPGVYIGALMIKYAKDNDTNTEDSIPDVIIKAGEDIEFASENGSITFEVTVLENGALQNAKYIIDENGNLKKDD